MSNATPVCHRLMAMPVVYHDGDRYIRTISHLADVACPCIGSRCAMWVPIVSEAGGVPVPRGAYGPDHGIPTGAGVCADNLRANAWPDPAAPVTKS